ncbi:MAG TPA: hypothetical protein VIM86_01470 [Thermodesulfobacteriota bacterium]
MVQLQVELPLRLSPSTVAVYWALVTLEPSKNDQVQAIVLPSIEPMEGMPRGSSDRAR